MTETNPNLVANTLLVLGAAGLFLSLVMMGRIALSERNARLEADTRFRDRAAVSGPVVEVLATPSSAAFLIDETEVTVDAYAACLQQGACSPPSTGSFCNWGKPDRGDHPINCVDWDQALSFCAWAGKRLPTLAEWTLAACGVDGRGHSWGNEEPAGQDCFDRDEKWEGIGGLTRLAALGQGTCPVRAHTTRSAGGALGMGGNVAEWTGEEESATGQPSNRIVQAGETWSWRQRVGQPPTCGPTMSYAPWYRSSLVGFRCGRSLSTR